MTKLSIIVPVFNEERTILEVLETIDKASIEHERHSITKEILVVDDCSTDGTRRILADLKLPNIRVIQHDANR